MLGARMCTVTRILLLHGEPRLDPPIETTVQMNHRLESQFLESPQGPGAAATSRTMHHIRLLAIQLAKPLLEIGSVEIKIQRLRHMSPREFLRSPDIQHDNFRLVREQLSGALGIHVAYRAHRHRRRPCLGRGNHFRRFHRPLAATPQEENWADQDKWC